MTTRCPPSSNSLRRDRSISDSSSLCPWDWKRVGQMTWCGLPKKFWLKQANWQSCSLPPWVRVLAMARRACLTLWGGQGRIGLISPYTNHFCATCNRLRVTSDGLLRTCLFSDKVYRIRPALRHPKLSLDMVERIIRAASRAKPIGYELLKRMPAGQGVCRTRMASIGG